MNKIKLLTSAIILAASSTGTVQASISDPQQNKITSSLKEKALLESTNIFLTKSRLAAYQSKIDNGDESWLLMTNRLDVYLNRNVWNKNKFSSAYALAYHLTGNKSYLEKAKELFWQAYSNWNYKRSSTFLYQNRFAHYTYDWIESGLTPDERKEFTALFKNWSSHWLGKKTRHTIESTALSEAFLLLASSLKDDKDLSGRLLSASDALLN
jgi:hypothetical protein